MPSPDDEQVGEQPVTQRSTEFITSGEIPVVYSNSARVQTSPLDVRIDFGIIEEATDARLVIKNSVRVMMAVPHAKLVAKLLSKQIETYEGRFGQVPDLDDPAIPAELASEPPKPAADPASPVSRRNPRRSRMD